MVKASELIAVLEAAIVKYGDLPVTVSDSEYGEDVERVVFFDDDYGPYESGRSVRLPRLVVN